MNKEKLKELKHKQQMAKELYLKLQGAIELIEATLKEQDGSKE